MKFEKYYLLNLTFILFILVKSISNQDGNENEIENEKLDEEAQDPDEIYRIFNHIMSAKEGSNPYNSKIRPINFINDTDKIGPVIIYSLLALKQIVSLDEKNQILTTSFDILLNWNDPRLKWDPSSYKNITTIMVPASSFWLPDIAIMNSASGSNLIKYESNLNMLIAHTGDVYLTMGFPSQPTRCKLNVYKYPFDTQKCSITIGSWQNSKKEFDFQASVYKKFNLDEYINNSVWDLKSVTQSIQSNSNRFKLVNYDIKELNLNLTLMAEDMVFELTLKRNPLYIMINGILPCFVLNCVILIAFGVPFVQQINLCKL